MKLGQRYKMKNILWILLIFTTFALANTDINVCNEEFNNGNRAKAFLFCKRAADNGDTNSQVLYAIMNDIGSGTVANKRIAFKYYYKAANTLITPETMSRISYAQYRIASDLHEDYSIPSTPKKAFDWYLKSANNGNSTSQVTLGQIYEFGTPYISKSYDKAVRWYKKAARQGQRLGQYNLAMAYKTGHGVKQNYTTAFTWLTKSAYGNLSHAQYELALAYYVGRGTDIDKKETFTWLTLSANQGNNKATNQLKIFCNTNPSLCSSSLKGTGSNLTENQTLQLAKDFAEEEIRTGKYLKGFGYISPMTGVSGRIGYTEINAVRGVFITVRMEEDLTAFVNGRPFTSKKEYLSYFSVYGDGLRKMKIKRVCTNPLVLPYLELGITFEDVILWINKGVNVTASPILSYEVNYSDCIKHGFLKN